MNTLKVLVVDDKKVIGDLFDFTLGYEGHSIKCCNDPREAIEAVKNERFDIAFLDIVMPDKDGVTLLQELKLISPQLPVVMMSGYSVEEKRLKAQELGAITCLKKPFEMDEVRQTVRMALGIDI